MVREHLTLLLRYSMQNESIVSTFPELRDHFDNWVQKCITEKELSRKIVYNSDNTNLRIVFLANRSLAHPEMRNDINNTINVATDNPTIQKLFIDQFRQIDPRTSGCDDMDTSYLRRGKDLYVFPHENYFLDRKRQFEFRFFPDESVMDSQVTEEIAKKFIDEEPQRPSTESKSSKCQIQ